jgi:hypothetical protein
MDGCCCVQERCGRVRQLHVTRLAHFQLQSKSVNENRIEKKKKTIEKRTVGLKSVTSRIMYDCSSIIRCIDSTVL